MAKTNSSKVPMNVTVSRPWQIAFIVVLIAGQIVGAGSIWWSLVHISHYASLGTWVFQSSYWLYPILYLGAGYLFMKGRVQGTLPRLFWAVLLTTLGATVAQACSVIANYIRIASVQPYGDGIWSTFGGYWIQMAVVFLAYVLVLAVIRQRSSKRA